MVGVLCFDLGAFARLMFGLVFVFCSCDGASGICYVALILVRVCFWESIARTSITYKWIFNLHC